MAKASRPGNQAVAGIAGTSTTSPTFSKNETAAAGSSKSSSSGTGSSSNKSTTSNRSSTSTSMKNSYSGSTKTNTGTTICKKAFTPPASFSNCFLKTYSSAHSMN